MHSAPPLRSFPDGGSLSSFRGRWPRNIALNSGAVRFPVLWGDASRKVESSKKASHQAWQCGAGNLRGTLMNQL